MRERQGTTGASRDRELDGASDEAKIPDPGLLDEISRLMSEFWVSKKKYYVSSRYFSHQWITEEYC